jgi:ribosomal-protein-alanine N-acetyltransferase
MSPPRLKLATPNDAVEIAMMSRCLIEVGLRGWAWHPQRVEKSIRARDTNVIVARVERRIAGFAIMQYDDENAHLCLLAVHPLHRRKGIGRALMDWLEETALNAGIATVELELRVNNYGARNFYHALGFRETYWIRGYYRGGEPAVIMSRNIRRAVPDRSTV